MIITLSNPTQQLFVAAKGGHLVQTLRLIAQGGNLNLRKHDDSAQGGVALTPYQVALREGQKVIALLLVLNGYEDGKEGGNTLACPEPSAQEWAGKQTASPPASRTPLSSSDRSKPQAEETTLGTKQQRGLSPANKKPPPAPPQIGNK